MFHAGGGPCHRQRAPEQEPPYTLANTGTQLFFGGLPGDALQFDYFLAGGVRQPIGSAGAVSLAYLYGLPVNVWADPYVTGAARTETARNSQGARVGWDGILGSALQLQYMFRAITIGAERSGTFLGLSAGESRLLDRAGNAHQVEIRYPFTIAMGHWFTPALSYTLEDLHGAAMRAQAYDFKLRYAHGARSFSVVLDGTIGRSVHDQQNPVFGRTQADLRYSASATVLYRTPFGWEPFGYRRWSAFATVRYSAPPPPLRGEEKTPNRHYRLRQRLTADSLAQTARTPQVWPWRHCSQA